MNNVGYLNQTVWATLAPSKVHGIGVFAIRDIPKGTQVWVKKKMRPEMLKLESFDGLHPTILEMIKQRWPLALQGDLFMSPNDDARLLSFMNHSNEPSYDPVTDTATRDIKEGEEIFEDYRNVPDYQNIYPFIDANN